MKALITGASSGIGRATAIECSKLGAKLILLGRSEDRLKETLENLAGSEHKFYSGDLTIDDKITEIVSKIDNIDGIVYSAGINDKSLIKSLNFCCL